MSSSSSASSDCLILCLEEFDSDLNITEGKVYVLHDSINKYVIRGNGRRDDSSIPFSFISYDNNLDSLVDFLEIFIGADSLCKLTLYNHNDLPLTSEEITFNYLHDNLCNNNIITAYYPDYLSKKSLARTLKAIKNVFNPYYESANENNIY